MPDEQIPENAAADAPVSLPTTKPAAEVATASTLPAAHAAGADPVAWSWPSIHPESRKFAAVTAAITLFGFFAEWEVVPWLTLALSIFILAFFRDPKRASPAGDGLILSPADGLVSQITEVRLPRQLTGDGGLEGETAIRVSVFMSVFDVHINRTPVAGVVRRIAYVPGAFLNADLDKASEENERQYFIVEKADGTKVGFTQIAGLVARRIIAFVAEGAAVSTGERIGLIRFGSRVDVFLPAGYQPQVIKGQRAVAGETVLAARSAAAAIPGPRQ